MKIVYLVAACSVLVATLASAADARPRHCRSEWHHHHKVRHCW